MKHITARKSRILSDKELAGYREWLKELDEEAREPSGDLSVIDEEVWKSFNPKSPVGVQVYESYSDEELLSFVLATMDHPGHKPRFDEIYCVYLDYLKLRFGNLVNVRSMAQTRRKKIAEEKKWPPDWPNRVSSAPLINCCEECGKPLNEEEKAMLEKICSYAVRTGYPPLEENLSVGTREFLHNRFGSWQKPLLEMGIPAVKKIALKHLHRYWSQERRKIGGMSDGKINENQYQSAFNHNIDDGEQYQRVCVK